MLMPTPSVTAIGIVAAIIGIVRGNRVGPMLLRGVVGAWVGFLAGALPGVLLDVVLISGGYLALFGHLGAAAVAAIAVLGAPASTRQRTR